MVVVAQLVRALDCGSRGRRFETGLPPHKTFKTCFEGFFMPAYEARFIKQGIKKYIRRSLKGFMSRFSHVGSAELNQGYALKVL